MTSISVVRFAVRALLLVAMSIASAVPGFAGPGAHGPGGEHLDAPAAETPFRFQSARPRLETHSEAFELVGYLREGELSLMINRYETNAPVLAANVEVSTGSFKAVAKFHVDRGEYVVDDPAVLKVLSTPGAHPLIFTIVAGSDSDLLEGTLTVEAASAHDHPHGHSHWLAYGLGALAFFVALAFGARSVRKRRRAEIPRAGGLS